MEDSQRRLLGNDGNVVDAEGTVVEEALRVLPESRQVVFHELDTDAVVDADNDTPLPPPGGDDDAAVTPLWIHFFDRKDVVDYMTDNAACGVEGEEVDMRR
jgi:hypothetical protein